MATCEREVATAWVGITDFDIGDYLGFVNVDATFVVDRETAARLKADDHVRLRLALIEVRDDGEGD